MSQQLVYTKKKEKLKEIREEFRLFDTKETTEVRLNIETHIATITLNNPKRLNSLTGKMMANFEDVLDKLEEETSNEESTLVGVIIEGEGQQNFCAGFDLDLAQEKFQSSESGEKLCLLMQNITERLRRLPLISVCAIEGYALGGGAEIASASDFRIASINSTVCFLHRNIGTVPGWGGATRLYEILGYSDALYYLATTKKLVVPEIGNSNAFFRLICAKGRTNEEARDFLSAFIPESSIPQATRNVKVLLSSLRMSNNTEHKLNLELAKFTELWGSPNNLKSIGEARSKKGKK